jgi:hypothetical protein
MTQHPLLWISNVEKVFWIQFAREEPGRFGLEFREGVVQLADSL